jgi:cation:H+ antiporter
MDKKAIFYLILTSILIYLSADWLIESIIKISEITGLNKSVIATSALAIGTSLPELLVTITAARRGNPEMAVGNVLGSNIFNTFAILGVCALIKPIEVLTSMLTFGVPFLVMITLLFLFSTLTKRITRWEGYFYLLLYIFFLIKIF